jgi:hypothetical protein
MLFQSAEAVGTSSHRLMGHRALAITTLMSGDYRAAHDFHRQALPFRDSTSDREFVRVTGQDQQVSFNSYYALNLWALGNTDDAWARADESLTLAREARHVSSLGYAYMHAVLLSLLADRPERDDLIAEMLSFTTEHRRAESPECRTFLFHAGRGSRKASSVSRAPIRSRIASGRG